MIHVNARVDRRGSNHSNVDNHLVSPFYGWRHVDFVYVSVFLPSMSTRRPEKVPLASQILPAIAPPHLGVLVIPLLHLLLRTASPHLHVCLFVRSLLTKSDISEIKKILLANYHLSPKPNKPNSRYCNMVLCWIGCLL